MALAQNILKNQLFRSEMFAAIVLLIIISNVTHSENIQQILTITNKRAKFKIFHKNIFFLYTNIFLHIKTDNSLTQIKLFQLRVMRLNAPIYSVKTADAHHFCI